MQFPLFTNLWQQFRRHQIAGSFSAAIQSAKVKNIPGTQRPARMPAKLPQCKSGFSIQIVRTLYASLQFLSN
jgi:hypothetical protein